MVNQYNMNKEVVGSNCYFGKLLGCIVKDGFSRGDGARCEGRRDWLEGIAIFKAKENVGLK